MKQLILIFLLGGVLLPFTAYKEKPAYTLFDKNGKVVSYSRLLKEAEQADVILFGELHNNPISHWMELSLLKDLYASKKDRLEVGAEMFETDGQELLNRFLEGAAKLEDLKKQGMLWPNFGTDYQPLLDFSAAHHIPFFATNMPRRFSRMVAREGAHVLDSISMEEKQWIAPLPVGINLSLPGYKKIMDGGIAGHGMDVKFIAEAQAMKDATMASMILKYRKADGIFLHYNGAYHSDNFEGIYWYLRGAKKDLKIITISTVEQEQIRDLAPENKGKADFIIAVPEDMTKTY